LAFCVKPKILATGVFGRIFFLNTNLQYCKIFCTTKIMFLRICGSISPQKELGPQIANPQDAK
jgi:hypothetical protein